MCEHKSRLSLNDRRFLLSIKVAPYVCGECERQAKQAKKIRLEQEERDERQEQEGDET